MTFVGATQPSTIMSQAAEKVASAIRHKLQYIN